MDENRIGWFCVKLLEITKCNYIVKLKKGDGLDGDNDVKNILPSHLGAVILSISKRFMKKFIREINGFYNYSICYGITDSL